MEMQQGFPKITIGLDLGDRTSRVCEIDAGGGIVKRAVVATTPGGMEHYFGKRAGCRVVLEASTHSPWVSRQLKELGHEVVVANMSEVKGHRGKRRNDEMDAEFLGRQGRADVKLLYPIQHRGAEAQQHLELIRARDQLVRARSMLINHVRGAVKAVGGRIGKCSSESFARRAALQVPEALRPAVTPVLDVIADLTRRIGAMDRQVEQLVEQKYPVAVRLQGPSGVGALTALAFVLLVEDPTRFKNSRDVGAFFGLVPRLDESSDSKPQLRITKAGDALGRRLLVSAARYILGPFGPECDLRRFGEAIAARGGKNASKRAGVAVARKLAVMMHRIWISGATYDPNYQQRGRAA